MSRARVNFPMGARSTLSPGEKLTSHSVTMRVRSSTAWVASLFTGFMFELAREVFTYYVSAFSPGSLYTGTLVSIVVVVVWFYYAALIFILGGEVGQVYELRRTRRLQREVFN